MPTVSSAFSRTWRSWKGCAERPRLGALGARRETSRATKYHFARFPKPEIDRVQARTPARSHGRRRDSPEGGAGLRQRQAPGPEGYKRAAPCTYRRVDAVRRGAGRRAEGETLTQEVIDGRPAEGRVESAGRRPVRTLVHERAVKPEPCAARVLAAARTGVPHGDVEGQAIPLREDSKGRPDQIVTISTMSDRPAKSAGLRVYRGRPAATAVAAMNRSTARRPRALRPAAPTAAYTRP